MERTRMSSGKFKETWEWNNFGFEEKDASGFLWPPRQFTCSFCRRKFRSAQALGGHMNVHRRDRAMLRQPPSWVVQCPNPNPNPNPNYLSSAPSATCPPHTVNSFLSLSLTTFSSLSSTSTDENMGMIMGHRCNPSTPLSPRSGDITKKSMRTLPRVRKLKGFTQEDEFKVLNNGDIVRLDLEMGLLKDTKEGLDLELRLGYS